MDTNKDLDAKTRAALSYILVISGIALLAYVLYQFGKEKDVLMLIIGIISGSMIGMPAGVYFAGSLHKSDTNVESADTVEVNKAP